MPRHFVLVSFGTDGDVYPYVALGAHLLGRGHRVTLLSDDSWRGRAEQRGLEFQTLVPRTLIDELLAHPDFWHPLKSGLIASKWGFPLVPSQYELLTSLLTPSTTLVANPGVIAARLVQETHGTPLATVLLQPGLIPSNEAPPTMPGIPYPRWAPRSVGRRYWDMVNLAGYFLIGRKLNPFRASLSLPPVQRFFDWWVSPQLVLGMFPDWYAPPAPDWPANTQLCGFPLAAGATDTAISAGLAAFLEAGPPPIAFTFGTGMMHGRKLFKAALEASRLIGQRALFLTRHPRQLPDPLPPFAHHAAHAPFHLLFPRCAAVVHHGGIGTVAKCLAAGVPQLVTPLAWDQPDNAARVSALGVGKSLRRSRVTAKHLARALEELLSGSYRQRCASVAARLQADSSLDCAADHLERLMSH